jgi:hypothetical protein
MILVIIAPTPKPLTMKKITIGLITILIGIVLVGMSEHRKKRLSYFWIYNAAGTSLIFPMTVPPSSLPVSCPPPGQKNCAAEYSSYSVDAFGRYIPAGGFIQIYLKPN